MNRRPMGLGSGLLLSLVLAALPRGLAAQDVLSLGSVSGARPGDLVTVPLRLRDRPGTPLNSGGDPRLGIQGISVTVEYSPPGAVDSLTLVRAGATSGLVPRFEAQIPGPSSQSWIVSFDEGLSLPENSAETIAALRLRLAADAAPGSTVELALAPETTALSSGNGIHVENDENGFLSLRDGSVEIAEASCTTADELCLTGDRFLVEVAWEDFQGATGVGNAVQLTNDAGYFWFFNDDNVEVVIKVLDGRGLNGNFWVFYGALSNVEYEITVTDTATGAVKVYSNPSGQFASVGDTGAFPGDAAGSGLALLSSGREPNGPVTKQGGCTAGQTGLCLLDGRFLLEMSWEDFQGATGAGNAVQLTDDAGYFWFFNQDNVELVVKTLDGRAINGHFWVFYGALSNVQFTLKVTDTETGEVKEYFNPLETFASVGDTQAF